jgi:transcriptional regulator with XRE-family HTH domain
MLGDMLAARRRAMGLTLRQMETRTGLSNPYLCQVETGKVSNPTVLAILAIADGYQIPVEGLIDAIAQDGAWRPRGVRAARGGK